jgi:hypothetical protein
VSQGQNPIAPEEFVLRRVHKNHVDPGPPVVISYVGFRPTPDDTEGLSVYRERLVTAAEVAASGRKSGEYFVARLSVRDLHALGLSVVADERAPGLAGHAIIPELSFPEYQRDKLRLRETQVALAALASQQIVQHPSA